MEVFCFSFNRSSLVPVFGFGQNDSFHQPFFTNVNWLKSYKRTNRSVLEKWVKLFIRGTLISLCGKFYIPCLPYNNPITVVGKIIYSVYNKLLLFGRDRPKLIGWFNCMPFIWY